jgi:hypothetical protein
MTVSGEDLVGGEAGLSHFEHFTAGGVFGLLPDEAFGEIPVSGCGNLFQELFSGFFTLTVSDLSLYDFSHASLEVFERIEAGGLYEFVVEFRGFVFSNLCDFEQKVHGFTTHLNDFGFEADAEGEFA